MSFITVKKSLPNFFYANKSAKTFHRKRLYIAVVKARLHWRFCRATQLMQFLSR